MTYLIPTLFYFVLLSLNVIVPTAAQSQKVAANKSDGKTVLERWNELMGKAMEEAGMIKHFGNPRKVLRGAQPELILRKDDIYFDKKKLSLGESIETWKEKIPAKSRCFSEWVMTYCVWDEYGLGVGTGHNSSNVAFVNVYINVDHSVQRPGTADYPDGRPAEPLRDDIPHCPFSGYLELNGAGIDAETEFWEIQAGSVDNRTLSCGLSGCSHANGPFGERAKIYVRLEGGSEHARLQSFQVNSDD